MIKLEEQIIEFLKDWIWVLLPIFIVQISLTLIALWDWSKKREMLGQNKLVWLLLIVFFNFFGPIIYLWFSHTKIDTTPTDDSEDEWRT